MTPLLRRAPRTPAPVFSAPKRTRLPSENLTVGKVVLFGVLALATVFMAFIFGAASALLPWWFMLAVFFAPLVALTIWIWPALGFFLALCFVFGVIPAFLGPGFGLGGKQIRPSEMILVVTFGAAFVKALAGRRAWLHRLKPYTWPLVILSLAFGLSLLYGRLYQHNEAALAEARSFVAWLVLPALLALTRDQKDIKNLVFAVIVLALIAAVAVIVQSLSGIRIMELGRVEFLDIRHTDVTRVTAGGATYLMTFALFWSIARGVTGIGRPWVSVLVGGVVLLALVLTFGRGVWAATAISGLAVMFVLGGIKSAAKGAVLGGVALALAILPVAIWQPKIVDAAFDRLTGTAEEVRSGGSFGWRKTENAVALQKIEQAPLLGVGLGGQYKQRASVVGTFAAEQTYIHNAYLWYPLKMGVWAVIIPWMFIAVMLSRSAKGIRNLQQQPAKQGVVAAAGGSFLTIAVVSFTQPEWSSSSGIAAIALLIGLVEVHVGALFPERRLATATPATPLPFGSVAPLAHRRGVAS